MANTKIFVITHKEFNMINTLPKENYTILTNGFPLVNDKYNIITVPKGYKDEIGGISDAEMSEVYMLTPRTDRRGSRIYWGEPL